MGNETFNTFLNMGRKKLSDEQAVNRFFNQRLKISDELNTWLDVNDWLDIVRAGTKRQIKISLFLKVCRENGITPERTPTGRKCLKLEMLSYSYLFRIGLFRLYDRMVFIMLWYL